MTAVPLQILWRIRVREGRSATVTNTPARRLIFSNGLPDASRQTAPRTRAPSHPPFLKTAPPRPAIAPLRDLFQPRYKSVQQRKLLLFAVKLVVAQRQLGDQKARRLERKVCALELDEALADQPRC